METTRICPECKAPLPAGVPDVFCRSCALRAALESGRPLGFVRSAGSGISTAWIWLAAHLRRLQSGKRADKWPEVVAASPPDKAGKSLSTSGAALKRGDFIGDYQILDKIGGNMAQVFKARLPRLGNKLFALKCASDPTLLDRFETEIKALGQLEHRNLVISTNAGSDGPWHFVAMEWIDGIDLNHLIKHRQEIGEGPLPVNAACEAARQAALGLQCAYERGLIHRDIKPSNLMLNREGIIKVIDLGLALTGNDGSTQKTEPGTLLGTMPYCAPEQSRNSSGVDIRADIYSLGCTLYHLLTGRAPYCDRKTRQDLLRAHETGPFPKLTEARPGAPPELEEVLARMTAKDRDSRHASPAEVAGDLEPFARGADLRPLVPPVPPTESDLPPMAEDYHKRQRRWPLRRWMAVIALLLAMVGAVVFTVGLYKKGTLSNAPTPVIVLMDTTAKKGIYDTNNYDTGRSNADELYNGLRGLDQILLPSALFKEGIGLDWAREPVVIGLKPALIIIHRSSFFHPLAARIGLKYPPFDIDEAGKEYEMFKNIYDAQDQRLRSFIGLVGSAVPHCQFLVYSRGTDTNWLSRDFRIDWAATLESNNTNLQGRIHTMVVPGVARGTFRDTNTMEEIKGYVREILKFPKSHAEKRN